MHYKDLIYDLWKFDIPYRKSLELPKELTFGMEIEFANAYLVDVNKILEEKKIPFDWKIKEDLTVSTFDKRRRDDSFLGGEITSPICHNDPLVWDQLKDVCNSLHELGAVATLKTGAHVHIGVNLLREVINYVINLINLWRAYEQIIYHSGFGPLGVMRPDLKGFAKLAAYILQENYEDILMQTTYDDLIIFLQDILPYKEYGIDFNHIDTSEISDTYNTVEFRYANGTIDEVFWQHLVDTDGHIMMYASSDRFDKELINYRAANYILEPLELAIEFSNLIFEKELDKLIFLKQTFNINSENQAKALIRRVERR